MTRFSRRAIALAALALALAALLYAQVSWGNRTFSYSEAAVPLERAMPSGGISQAYLGAVGGVAFSQTAVPEQNVGSIELAYDSQAADGSRLKVVIDKTRAVARIFDWQLVPIARFADSRFDSCFTLFGSLVNKQREEQVVARKGRVLNYHPAFADTLLGLRLFQLDVLVGEEASGDLPKVSGAYLLGAGEAAPDVRANEEGAVQFSQHIASVEAATRAEFRSYLICDYGRKISFRLQEDAIVLTGDPYFYCWRNVSDDPGFNQERVRSEAAGRLSKELSQARTAGGTGFSERSWYIAQLIEELKRYEAGYRFYSAGTVVDVLKLAGDAERSARLQRYTTESLSTLLLQLRVGMTSEQVVFLEDYSNRFSSRIDLLRSMNPAVWDAGTAVMRYAALFRYCRQRHPENWAAFLKSLASVRVVPQVRTPTVMM
jgi:hypothetical protein